MTSGARSASASSASSARDSAFSLLSRRRVTRAVWPSRRTSTSGDSPMRPPHLDLPEARLRLVGFAVSRLSVTPVKGLALQAPDEIELTAERAPRQSAVLPGRPRRLSVQRDRPRPSLPHPSVLRSRRRAARARVSGRDDGRGKRAWHRRRLVDTDFYGRKVTGTGRRRPVRRRPQPLRGKAATTRPSRPAGRRRSTCSR